jgi:hypothetical protein
MASIPHGVLTSIMSVRAEEPGGEIENVTSLRHGITLAAFADADEGHVDEVGTGGHVWSAGVTVSAGQPLGTVGRVTEYFAPGLLVVASAHWSRTAFLVASAALRRRASACAESRWVVEVFAAVE